eukprot:TRINITY_DN62316_c0_g1_i1.p1 TRINITY_DN62316_c0_g1~~TRINITY_DN62316_c0_g1_i1.p1  ORF type:complete len:607 (-),score=96.24 TRINITY_DN62316_c0_g1_i1:345-2165(-)
MDASAESDASNSHFGSLRADSKLIVETSQGTICGANLHGGVAFLGVPFAEPPVGQLRWAAPTKRKPWEGILPCTRFGPSCPQRTPPLGCAAPAREPGKLPPGLDEDCLYLNVYTPSLEGKRPTLVWFHGGNLTGGSTSGGVAADPASRAGANPCFLALEHDLVVVSAAYRVNVFGFLNLQGGDANCGLLDAVAALHWVKDEIAKFGGDPQNTTVCGLSAGAHICSQLLCMPSASGLFHKAICMSGSSQWSLGSQEDHHRRIAEPFAQKLGFKSLEEMSLAKARQIPAEALRQAYAASGAFLEAGTLNIDGTTVPMDPLDMMLNGCARHVKVLSGVTRDEGVFSTRLKRKGSSRGDLINDVKCHFASACYLLAGDLDLLRSTCSEARDVVATEMVESYEELAARFMNSSVDVQQKSVNLSNTKFPAVADENYELAVKVLGDHDFLLAHLLASWALSQHGDVYAYVFSGEVATGKFIAGHGSDQPFLFGTTAEDSALQGLSSHIMEAWAAFARSGDPSTPSIGKWLPISFPGTPSECTSAAPSRWGHMNFECGRVGMVNYGEEEAAIWLRAAAKLGELLGKPPQGGDNLRKAASRMASSLNGLVQAQM